LRLPCGNVRVSSGCVKLRRCGRGMEASNQKKGMPSMPSRLSGA